jgi:hypothetical protein
MAVETVFKNVSKKLTMKFFRPIVRYVKIRKLTGILDQRNRRASASRFSKEKTLKIALVKCALRKTKCASNICFYLKAIEKHNMEVAERFAGSDVH